jgi:surfeit locus 1 family protein
MRRHLLWPTAMAVPALAVLLGLGTWQLQRHEWKSALIAAREAALAAPPIALPSSFDAARHAFRRVRLEGRFLHEREMHTGPRTRDGQAGLEVITPLLLDDGSAVLVMRGWVPAARTAPETRAEGQVAGRVMVEGLIRRPAARGRFVPDNQPGDNIWFSPDAAAMAAHAGLDRARDFFVEAGPAANPGGLPRGRRYRVALPNDHLGYAITWYALAVALLVIYILFVRRRRA